MFEWIPLRIVWVSQFELYCVLAHRTFQTFLMPFLKCFKASNALFMGRFSSSDEESCHLFLCKVHILHDLIVTCSFTTFGLKLLGGCLWISRQMTGPFVTGIINVTKSDLRTWANLTRVDLNAKWSEQHLWFMFISLVTCEDWMFVLGESGLPFCFVLVRVLGAVIL